RFTPYADKKLTPEKIVSVIQHLCEGSSVRSTERLLKVHRDTVLNMLMLAGESAQSVGVVRPRSVGAVRRKPEDKVSARPTATGDASCRAAPRARYATGYRA
ncbi:MAG: hypothetical protein ACRD3T_22220, partial [Terriglobia bacterium]